MGVSIPFEFRAQDSGAWGRRPSLWAGQKLPDGDAHPFSMAAIGSQYTYIDRTNVHIRQYLKVKNDLADNDWMEVDGVIVETVAFGDFTDGGGAAGTYSMKADIPVGAFLARALVTDVTGFTGNTSAVLTIGDGTDVDRYNTGTPSVFTTVAQVVMGAPSGVQEHTAAKTPVLTVTSATDFTLVTAGQMTVKLYYQK